MPPSAPIDSELNGTTIYVLEDASVWKGEGAGAGSAVWTEIYTAAAHEAASGDSGCHFTRIIARGPIIWLLGYAQTAEQVGGDTYTLYCWRSLNSGLTWSYDDITEFALSAPDYYFDGTAAVDAGGSGYSDLVLTVVDDYTIRVSGTWSGGTTWHLVHCHFDIGGTWGTGVPASVKARITGMDDPIAADGIKLKWTLLNLVTPTDLGGDIYEYTGMNVAAPSRQQIWIEVGDYGAYSGDFEFTVQITEVDGVAVANYPPNAFDVAHNDLNWMYVSVGGEIWCSTTSGWLWDELYTDHGAVDICCDPQLAGVIYYISDEDGSVNCMVRQPDKSGVIQMEGLDTGTIDPIFRRLARDANSGRLWHVKGGASIECRYNGAWTTQLTGISGGRGIRAYAGGHLICLADGDIYISDDYGATWTAKKGGWAGYASGISGHRVIP